ncbi:MAG: hypothetical protein K9N55_07355 [Phycisphaerae bacterium]|nr:hypothetical protein [Phycisphaerae bacterium]
MKKQEVKKPVIPTLLATVYTIPALTGCHSQHHKDQPLPPEPAKSVISSQAVKQEVIQLLRQGQTDHVTLNIAGQAGTYFRVFYSQTGDEDSYALVPGGKGLIGANGLGSVDFGLKELGKDEVYLKVRTSDTDDFAVTRVTPKPIVLEVEPVQIKASDVMKSMDFQVRTPSAVAGVRG